MDSQGTMKAMGLCAGYGTRLGDLTRDLPKPMLPLQGRPMLEYTLMNLRRHGFDEIAINLHFQGRLVQDHFGDGSGWQVKLVYSHEPELLGTAGGVKKMRENCGCSVRIFCSISATFSSVTPAARLKAE